MLLRLCTGTAIIGLLIAGVLWVKESVFITLLSLVILIAGYEYNFLVKIIRRSDRHLSTAIALLSFVVVLQIPEFGLLIAYLSVLSWLFTIFFMISSLHISRFKKYIRYWRVLGTIYIVAFGYAIWFFYSVDPILLLLLVACVSAFDTGAYIGGSLFGKTPFFQRYSPNKTWQGFIGGCIFSGIIVSCLAWYFAYSYIFYFAIFCISVLSVFGDLYISVLKRMSKMKDTGKLLPGHGGILDRIDSLLLCMPMFMVFSYYLI